jgi:ethanolamine utilization cobalamin adenosyltransferase
MIGAIIADIFADAYIVTATFVAFALIGAMLFLVRVIRQYVGETKQHVELMKELVLMQKKLVEAQTNPFIYVDMGWDNVRSDKSELKIFIKNVGRSHALDINFIDVEDDFALSTLGEKGPVRNFKETWFVDHGLKGLAPEREIELARVTHKAVEQIPKTVEVSLTYKNTRGDLIQAKYPLDFPGYVTMR